jgi:hypothetical protein
MGGFENKFENKKIYDSHEPKKEHDHEVYRRDFFEKPVLVKGPSGFIFREDGTVVVKGPSGLIIVKD